MNFNFEVWKDVKDGSEKQRKKHNDFAFLTVQIKKIID